MAEQIAQPQWISPPGEIVARILTLNCIELDDFASRVGLSVRFARKRPKRLTFRISEYKASKTALGS